MEKKVSSSYEIIETSHTVETVDPPSLQGDSSFRNVLVSSEQPQSEDTLGEDIENGIEADLLVDRQKSDALRDAPNDGIERPEYQGEESDRVWWSVLAKLRCVRQHTVELRDLLSTGVGGNAARNDEDIDDVDKEKAGDRIPAPAVHLIRLQRGEESRQNHAQVGKDQRDSVNATETSEHR